ncbi:MAG: T9SS type A sorting domain-containing protein, partial [Bacteroidota bacterium]
IDILAENIDLIPDNPTEIFEQTLNIQEDEEIGIGRVCEEAFNFGFIAPVIETEETEKGQMVVTFIQSGVSKNDNFQYWSDFGVCFNWDDQNGFDVDYAIFRIHFISDSLQTNKRGFMIDNLDCGVQDFCHIIGINNSENSNNTMLYPNPVTKKSRLEFQNDLNEKIILNIYNSQGQLMNISETKNNYFEIWNLYLSKGIYFFKLNDNYKTIDTGKFIIN